MKILSMVSEGKITADEAARLLDAVGNGGGDAGSDGGSGGGGAERAGGSAGTSAGGAASTIHVRVTDSASGDTRVNFALPLGMARFVSNMVPRGQLDAMATHGVDLDAALDAIDAGATGVVVDTDADDGHHVKVWLD